MEREQKEEQQNRKTGAEDEMRQSNKKMQWEQRWSQSRGWGIDDGDGAVREQKMRGSRGWIGSRNKEETEDRMGKR
jgi:hypothetical protein